MHTIRLFVEVATCRSFSQAAGRHGITQSAASQRVGQLEKRLGVTLLDRSVRPLGLTSAGEEFLRGCRDLLDRYDRLEQRIARRQTPLAGSVRVDAIYSAGIGLLNQIKDAFERQHPQVSVTVEYKRPEAVYEAVREQRCELGIVSYPQRWRDVGSMLLRNERMAVVCSPRHPLAHRQVLQASELHGRSMIGFEPGLPLARRVQRYLREHHAEVRITSVFDNIDTIKSTVAITEDLAVLPKRTVLHEVAVGALVAVELEPELVRPLGIIYPKQRQGCGGALAPAAQALVDYLLEHAGPNVERVELAEGAAVSARRPAPRGDRTAPGRGHDDSQLVGGTR